MKFNDLIKNSKVIATLIVIAICTLLYINPKIVAIILIGTGVVLVWMILVALIELIKLKQKVMNKEQQELLNEAYKNWKAKGRDFWEEQIDGMFTSELGEEKVDKISQEEFINKCKTDTEFSEKWGLKIEERELSEDEGNEIRDMQYFKNNLHQALKGSDTKIDWENIPTRLITITYNDKTIESYE